MGLFDESLLWHARCGRASGPNLKNKTAPSAASFDEWRRPASFPAPTPGRPSAPLSFRVGALVASPTGRKEALM